MTNKESNRYKYYNEIFYDSQTIFKGVGFDLNKEIQDNKKTVHNEFNGHLLARLEQNSSSDFAMKKHLWSIASNAEFSLNFLHIKLQLEKMLERVYAGELQGESGKQAIIKYKKFEKEWEKIFGKKGLPKQTSLIAYNESKIKYGARSYAGAVGYFQFISQTGKTYGLKSDKFMDERMDPMKSANAAAKYLADLRDMWYELNIQNNYQDKISKEEIVIIGEKGLEEILREYKINSEFVLKYNNLKPEEIKEGIEIKIPTEYDIDKKSLEGIKKDSLYLALSSYNGGLAVKLKGVNNYEKYVEKMSSLIKQTKLYSNTLNGIIKTIKENKNINMEETIDNMIKIFASISDKFFKIDFFEQTIQSLQEIKNSKRNIGTKKKQLLNIIDGGENYGNYFEYWYFEILAQNLFYPAKLFAVKKAYSNSDISKIENNQNLIHNPLNLSKLASKHGTDLNGLTFIKLAKSLGLKPQDLYEYNHHILSPRGNIGDKKDFWINIPHSMEGKIEKVIGDKLWKKE
ncbi:MAG: transglycosylase SLT domain-containing protein, partial [Candidatus Absconditabacteria bacterium]